MQEPSGNTNSRHAADLTRRGLILSGMAFLAGCATSGPKKLPTAIWPSASPRTSEIVVKPTPSVSGITGVESRLLWAKGRPVPSLMDRMLPIKYITIHHDGMNPFHGTGAAECAARVELIRRAHRNRGWGDIGYHFAIDASGRVWEGRPLNWQGAHVKDYNEGNIGILVMGNFEQQHPSSAQISSMQGLVKKIRRKYGIPVTRVKTHREWASTLCPGRNLQSQIDLSRSYSRFG